MNRPPRHGQSWSPSTHAMKGWGKAHPTSKKASKAVATPAPAGSPMTKHVHVFHHRSKG